MIDVRFVNGPAPKQLHIQSTVSQQAMALEIQTRAWRLAHDIVMRPHLAADAVVEPAFDGKIPFPMVEEINYDGYSSMEQAAERWLRVVFQKEFAQVESCPRGLNRDTQMAALEGMVVQARSKHLMAFDELLRTSNTADAVSAAAALRERLEHEEIVVPLPPLVNIDARRV